MRYVEVGGARVSAVGLGTWQFGSGEWGYGSAYAEEVAPSIVRRSLEVGVTLFDTAEIYAMGRSERILGRALGARRDDAFVATKLFPVLPVDPVVGWRARRSLARLGTDRVDLYQLHWPNPVVPPAATAAAVRRLLDGGLARHAGVSNYSLLQWQALEEHVGRPVLSNQVRYSLLDRRPERELLPWAQSTGRIVIAYSPLAQGLLSGRYDAANLPSGLRARTGPFLPDNVRAAEPLIGALREVAAAHQAAPAQVALAWLLRRPNVVVIPGASSVGQAESNAAAADLVLAEDEDRALTAASDGYRPVTTVARAGASLVRRRVHRVVDGLRA